MAQGSESAQPKSLKPGFVLGCFAGVVFALYLSWPDIGSLGAFLSMLLLGMMGAMIGASQCDGADRPTAREARFREMRTQRGLVSGRSSLSPEAMDILRQAIELEATEAQTAPARNGRIANLPTHKVTAAEVAGTAADSEHKSCTICMEEFAVRDDQKTLPCFHRFHSGCIDQWLHQQGNCPICKHRVDA